MKGDSSPCPASHRSHLQSLMWQLTSSMTAPSRTVTGLSPPTCSGQQSMRVSGSRCWLPQCEMTTSSHVTSVRSAGQEQVLCSTKDVHAQGWMLDVAAGRTRHGCLPGASGFFARSETTTLTGHRSGPAPAGMTRTSPPYTHTAQPQ
jgi:hypothetical protein